MRPETDLSSGANFVAAKLFTAGCGDLLVRLLAAGGITSEQISATRRTGGNDGNRDASALLGICHRTLHTARPQSPRRLWHRNPIPTIPKTLDESLRKKRIEAGQPQPQVADLLKVSLATIVKWEANRTKPLGEFRERVVAFLVSRTEPKSKSNSALESTWVLGI